MKKAIVFALCFCIGIYCLEAQESKEDLHSVIDAVMNKYDCIGVSVVVVKNNEICFKNSYGYNPDYNDEQKRETIPEDGIFWWASVSKTFISSAIMQLVERGKLSLDDDVNKYLDFEVRNPRFPGTPITIQMMLSHRSSINDSNYRYGFERLKPAVYSDFSENYNDYEPGMGYFYCNMNYNLLAAIVEKVSCKRFDEYVREHISKPLGLSGSFNKLDLDSNLFVKTYSYDQKKQKFYKYKPYRHYDKKSLNMCWEILRQHFLQQAE